MKRARASAGGGGAWRARRSWLRALALLALAAVPGLAPAQEPPAAAAPPAPAPAPPRQTFEVGATTASIAVDGELGEAPWQLPPTFTLDYETYPADNAPPPARTEVWITYDSRNLYVAVRAQDPEPQKIRARLRDRDNAFQDDFVGVVLDTFNDERRGFEFFVNPLGVQMDLTQNDVTGNEDSSWDAIWASAGKVTAEGYQVEMAIPFSSLRFPRGGEAQTWGVDAVRIWPRDQRRRFGLVRQERGRNCYLCVEAKLAGFAGITPGRNVEVDPTVTAHDSGTRGADGDPFDSERKVDPGITARWGITPGLTLNATVNPDFSQVEADAAQLDVNTQFALFYPEKRPFFLEGADIFDTKIGAVYTRNIADPDWGIKVTGKQGASAFGAIVARDTRTNLLLPGSQVSDFAFLDEGNTSSILRYRRDLAVGSGSALGGLFTDRESTDYHNRVGGVDGLFRWGVGEAVRVELLASDTAYPLALSQDHDEPTASFHGEAVRAVYQHTTEQWMGYASYYEVTAGFRADLGFIPQSDYRKGYFIYEKYWYADRNQHWWSRFTAASESTWTYDHDGNPLQRQVSPYVWLNGPRQSFLQLYLGLGDSFFAGRSFDRNFLVFSGEAQPTREVYVNLDGRVGQEIDYANAQQAHIVRLHPLTRLDLGSHLRLELSDTYQSLDVRGGRLFRVHLGELRATYQLNVRTFVRVITQYQDLRRNPDLYASSDGLARKDSSLFNQLLFSYKLNPQTVLFLGYSDDYLGGGTDLDRQGLWQTDRTVFFKVGYAFVM